MKQVTIWFFPILAALFCANAWAEGNCPPGQYPIGGQGAVGCAPIPGYNQEQPAQSPRPLGKWIKTWGAIAGDGIDNLGVSTGKLEKKEAEQDALAKCEGISQKKCHIVSSYRNQCISVADPSHGGTMVTSGGPSIEVTSRDSLADCRKRNLGSECSIIYTNCTDQIFQKF